MFGKKKVAPLVAEFLGTFSLACAVLVVAKQINLTFFPAVVAGGTLALMVLVIGFISGAHINPAVTIGLWTLRKVATTTAIMYIFAQMLGGAVAWRFSEYMLSTDLPNIANTSFDIRVLIAEIVGTLIFTFGIASAVFQGYKGLRQAFTIGASLTLGIFIAALGSNGVLNPAVALGIQSWSFVYVLGPIIGSIIGMNLYAQLFAPNLPGVTIVSTSAKNKPAKKRK